MDNDNNLYKILKLAFEHNYSLSNVEQVFAPYLDNGIKFKRIKKGTDYINSGMEIKKLSIMLTGKSHILRYSVDGKSVVIDSQRAVRIYGLNEMINNIDCYLATVSTIKECCFIEIPIYFIKKKLIEDQGLSYILLRHVSDMLNEAYERNCSEMLNTNEQKLISYLYKSCVDKTFPRRINVDRKTMALELNISLRSLYRYVEHLKNKNIISINCGKIEITEEQFNFLKVKMERL